MYDMQAEAFFFLKKGKKEKHIGDLRCHAARFVSIAHVTLRTYDAIGVERGGGGGGRRVRLGCGYGYGGGSGVQHEAN